MRDTEQVRRWSTAAPPLLLAALIGIVAGCGGSQRPSSAGGGSTKPITVWIGENQPERLSATRANAADVTRRSGIAVKVVPIGDDTLPAMIDKATRAGSLPDVAQLGMASGHAYLKQGLRARSPRTSSTSWARTRSPPARSRS